jgi:hypothetical protein
MKFKIIATLALTMTGIIASAKVGAADTGLQSHYIGVGLSAGLKDGGRNEGATTSFAVQGRYNLRQSPLSIRGSVAFADGRTSILPMVSYDFPLAENTNFYLGGGYSIITGDGNKVTPLGNQNAPVITAGLEKAMSKNLVIFGDLKWGLDGYRSDNSDAVALQAGVGLNF